MSIENIQQLNVGLNSVVDFAPIKMKQFDKNTRRIEITLLSGSDIYEIPEGAIAKFQATKPDSTIIFDDCDIENGMVVYKATEQLSTYPGIIKCEIGIYETDTSGDTSKDGLLQSATFNIWVEESVMDRNAVISSNEFNTLTIMINTITGLVERAESIIEEINIAISNTESAIANTEIAINNAEQVTFEAQQATVTINATNQTIINSENTRIESENKRQSDEIIRQSQESTRQTNTADAINRADAATTRANLAAESCEDIASGIIQLPDIGTVGTYTKVTTDAKGRVVDGDSPANIEDIGITNVYNKSESNTLIDTKIDKTSIVDNLTTTVEGTVLEGRQGKALSDKIGTLSSLTTTSKDDLVGAVNEVNNHISTVVKNVKEYNVSGSSATYTGTISASSKVLSLSSAGDFNNGHGIVIENAGIAPTLSPPAGVSISVQGTAGTTTYTYSISAIDVFGGMTPVASATATTGAATLNMSTNYNIVSWAMDTSVYAYAIYRTGGTLGDGLISFRYQNGIVNGATTTFEDRAFPSIQAPFNIPSTAPTSVVNRWLSTKVVSGGKTTSVALETSASNTVSGKVVAHDDTNAIQLLLNESGRIFFPKGTYNIVNCLQQNAYKYNLVIKSNTEIFGEYDASVIKLFNSYMGSFMFINHENTVSATEADHNIHVHDLVLDGGLPNSNYNMNGQMFSNTSLFFVAANGGYNPYNFSIQHSIFRNSVASTTCFTHSHDVTISDNRYYNVLGGPSTNGSCYNFFITNNNIANSGDDCISCNATGTDVNRYIIISGNRMSTTGGRGIIAQGNMINIVGNIVSETASSGICVWNTDDGEVLNNITINDNIVFGHGIYTGGVNGYLTPTGSLGIGGNAGIFVADYPGVTTNQVYNISINGNTISGGVNDKNIQVLGCNSTLSIDKVTIGNNILDTNGKIYVTGTVLPTNVVKSGNTPTKSLQQRGAGTVSVITAGLQAISEITFTKSFSEIPKVYITITNVTTALAGYVNIMAYNVTTTGFLLIANSYTPQVISYNWEAFVD